MKKTTRMAAFFLSAVISLSLLPVPVKAIPAMEVDAGAAILLDADYHAILYEQHAYEKMYPASLVKIMTVLLAVEAVERGDLSPDRMIAVSSSAINELSAGGVTLNIRAGDVLSLNELLYCAMVGSSNEACNILAEAVSGDIGSFVSRMNRRAAELGLEHTSYTNTHGLHHENQYTTAYDTALLTQEAISHELFRTLVAADEYTVQAEAFSGQRFFYCSNYLLSAKKIPGYVYRYAFGVRTGYTPEAGSCLSAAAEKNDRTLISVVLNAKNGTQEDGSYQLKSFSESSRLLDWGFSHYALTTLITPTSLLGEVPVTLSQVADYVVIHPETELSAMLPDNVDVGSFTRAITLFEPSVEAPISKGQILGTLTLTHEGNEYGPVNVIALNDVERSDLLYKIQRTKDLFETTTVKLAAAVLLILLGLLLFYSVLSGKKRSRKHISNRNNKYLNYPRKPRKKR